MVFVAANVVNGSGPISGHATRSIPSRLYTPSAAPSLAAFQKLCSKTCTAEQYPLASTVASNIPIYDLSSHNLADETGLNLVQDEWHHILLSGPGVLVLKHFFTDHSLIDRVNSVFTDIIASELCTAKGDHFATSGKNSRIWNSFQKHALRDPASFVDYYTNPWLALICSAWLGPAYQITAQVNVVRPGGASQVAHRDYHLGFQTADACARYPKAMQVASQLLTLQGGVAHSAVPLDSGPTRFLPFSQQFEAGFMAYRLPEFQRHFDRHWVSLALEAGDALFFNPALFHAAGQNRTADVERSVNLLQVSSAFGKTMEKIDSLAIIASCWEALSGKYAGEGLSAGVQAGIAAIADGYPFPTNLDKRPPAPGGMAPESEADVVLRGLMENWTSAMVVERVQGLQIDSSL